jgi:hypothetical protein
MALNGGIRVLKALHLKNYMVSNYLYGNYMEKYILSDILILYVEAWFGSCTTVKKRAFKLRMLEISNM